VRVLAVNAGSSSLKLALLDGDDETLAARELAAPGGRFDPAALREALEHGLGEADAVAHRMVHGGRRFRTAVPVDAGVEAALRELVEMAPLHQSSALAVLDAVSAALPGVPAVACFDTAFHATLPAAAATYPLPAAWRERWDIHRYGFHGLSHGWVARRAPALLAAPAAGLRLISCHLGAGASLCAINDGRSVDTTMGFTPLEGLMMATRSGSVDPGLLLWLLERPGMSAHEIGHALEHDSGLLGLAGTADMRAVLSRADHAEESACLALEVYLHRLRAGVAAMAAALGGVDALVFTGGIGEHAPALRAGAAERLGFLGLAVDPQANLAVMGDGDISAPGASARTIVLAAREDLEMARQARAALAGDHRHR
jgi:acetate kinase